MKGIRRRGLRLDCLIFALSPVVQLRLVTGDTDRLTSRQVQVLHDLAGESSRNSTKLAAITGLCARVGRSEVLLISIPTDVLELATGRPGLPVTYGLLVSKTHCVTPALFKELLSILAATAAQGLNGGPGTLADVATSMSTILQNDQGDAALSRLRSMIAATSLVLSQLLSAQGRGKWSHPCRKHLNARVSRRYPELAEISMIVDALTERRRGRSTHYAYYVPVKDLHLLNGRLSPSAKIRNFTGEAVILSERKGRRR
jgi:hypothetical protein